MYSVLIDSFGNSFLVCSRSMGLWDNLLNKTCNLKIKSYNISNQVLQLVRHPGGCVREDIKLLSLFLYENIRHGKQSRQDVTVFFFIS